MARIVKIKPIPRSGGAHQFTLSSSLRKAGLSRVPSTKFTITPYYDLNFKKYWTGLDEEASEIMKMSDDKERKNEQDRIQKLRDKLEKSTGLELGARSDYYRNISNPKEPNTPTGYGLVDGENVFNLDVPDQYITFLWLSKHPQICRSLKDWDQGNCDPRCVWYIENVIEETELKVNKKKEQNKAAGALEKLSGVKRKKIAIIIDNLGVTYKTSDDEVYAILDDYIKDGDIKNVQKFLSLTQVSDEVLDGKYLAKACINESILVRFGAGIIRECETCPPVANSFEELEIAFADPAKQELYIVYAEKLKKYINSI